MSPLHCCLQIQEPPTPGRGTLPTSPGQFDSAPDPRRAGRFGPKAQGGGGGDGGGGGGAGLGAESGMNFAERMMAKMGHKEGQGQTA